MAITTYGGQLNQNEIYASQFNQIISQLTFGDMIKGPMFELVNMARVDGSMYGDTKLYTSTNILTTSEWGNDAEAMNLLELDRQDEVSTQALTLDVFRQIRLTVDNYLSKRMFMDEGAFQQFQSVLLGTIKDTRDVYDATTYNAYLGTHKSDIAAQNISVDLTTATTGLNGEEKARVRAQTIAKALADLETKIEYLSTDISNQYGYERARDFDDFVVVWNADYVNEITELDIPTIFHNEGLVKKFGEYKLPSFCFGDINTAGKAGDGSTVFSLKEQVLEDSKKKKHHVWATQAIPTDCTAPANTSYTKNAKVICKIYKRGAVPYMSAFETATDFFNPRSLTETHYLTFGRNTIEALYESPYITLTEI